MSREPDLEHVERWVTAGLEDFGDRPVGTADVIRTARVQGLRRRRRQQFATVAVAGSLAIATVAAVPTVVGSLRSQGSTSPAAPVPVIRANQDATSSNGPIRTATASPADATVRVVAGSDALPGITFADGGVDGSAYPGPPTISSVMITCHGQYYDSTKITGVTYEDTSHWMEKQPDPNTGEIGDVYQLDSVYSRFTSQTLADKASKSLQQYVRNCLMVGYNYQQTPMAVSSGKVFAAYRVFTQNKPPYGQYKGGVQITVIWTGSARLISTTVLVPSHAAATKAQRVALARRLIKRALDDSISRVPRAAH